MMKLSIITINLNNVNGLEKTIESVSSQTFKDFEYIIIDGGSNDGSVELINKYKSKISYFSSEKDKGVYNAQNKGIKASNGDYVFFLNSGDYLIDKNILAKFSNHLLNYDIVYGNLEIKGKENSFIKTYPQFPSFYYFIDDTLPHSGGAFIKRELFDKYGFYDENLKIVSDWKFYLTVFSCNIKYQYIEDVISVFDFDGISSKAENQSLIFSERTKVLEENFSFHYRDLDKVREIKNNNRYIINSRVIKYYLLLRKLLEKYY